MQHREPEFGQPGWRDLGQEPALFDVGGSGHGSIYRAFEASARCHAHRTAVSNNGETLTFRELEEAAARVHTALASCEGGPRNGVGLMFANPVQVIAAILGVLRAGSF